MPGSRSQLPHLTIELLKLAKAQCAGLEDVESNRTAGLGRRPGRARECPAMLASAIQKVLEPIPRTDSATSPSRLPVLIH